MDNKIIQNEEEVLKFWREKKIFEKSVNNRPESKPYVFYDGPPFATGLPHYGHIVASLMKDVVPRYWTMRGYRVERKWGWDCHGLPIENLIEQKLQIKSHKEIVDFGVAKFNNECHAMVLQYANDWKKVIERMGRWVDMEHDYKTMDLEYMESVWWVFNELWKKDLIYHGYKPMHICPRCETTLSNFEVTQGYKNVKDIAVTVKFKIKSGQNIKTPLEPESERVWTVPENTYFLAWTTTPWTLPGNVALAVGEDIDYVLIKILSERDGKNTNVYFKKDEYYIVAKNKISPYIPQAIAEGSGAQIDRIVEVKSPNNIFDGLTVQIFNEYLKGADLISLEYEPLFPYFKDTENAFRVVAGDFVTTEDGTGVVHIAPAFGEDDYRVGQREKIGWVQHVGMDGRFTKDVADFSGLEVKPKEDPTSADIAILKYLAAKNLIFAKEKFEHSYPHCWRCDSPLLNYATSSWFIKVTELTDDMLKNNKKIRWVPKHMKDGRFGKWLEGARDWAVSRNRFWGDPLPIWQAEDGDMICVGSVAELEKLSGEKITDIHKHLMDKIVIKKGGKKYKRVPEVLDCWFESGSMPYGQKHYPFENKEEFETGFPAEFIAEGQDQTRGWFYTLHVLATALTRGKEKSIPVKNSEPAFKNVIVNGIVLAEDGKKMSKRLKNYPDPMEVVAKYGADALRYYLLTSPVMYAENLNFSENEVREMWGKLLNTWSNVLDLYLMYGNRQEKFTKPSNVLDQWILAKLAQFKKEITEKMDAYLLSEASRPLLDFITELSQWHIRRSRDRIKEKDAEALGTLRYVLLEFAKISAPFTPFMAEHTYKELRGELESVHLEDWPKYKKITKAETDLLAEMQVAREVVEKALALRAEKKIKVRQPLAELQISNCKLQNGILNIVAEEINVRSVIPAKAGIPSGNNWAIKDNVALDLEITPELRDEGAVREFVRGINALRKTAGLTPQDSATVYIAADQHLAPILKKYEAEILKSVIGKKLLLQKSDTKYSGEVKLESETVWIGIEK
ncbi:MAG: isoleucine--tRNA ligase [bacterium]